MAEMCRGVLTICHVCFSTSWPSKFVDGPQTLAAVTDCLRQHNCSLRTVAERMVAKRVPEPSEDSYLYTKPHLGILSKSVSALSSVLGTAQRWLALGRHEAAFHLIIACTDKGAGFEDRGHDSEEWQEFDMRADRLLSEAIAHVADDWDLDLEVEVKEMKRTQKSRSDFGYELVWSTALPALQSKIPPPECQ